MLPHQILVQLPVCPHPGDKGHLVGIEGVDIALAVISGIGEHHFRLHPQLPQFLHCGAQGADVQHIPGAVAHIQRHLGDAVDDIDQPHLTVHIPIVVAQGGEAHAHCIVQARAVDEDAGAFLVWIEHPEVGGEEVPVHLFGAQGNEEIAYPLALEPGLGVQDSCIVALMPHLGVHVCLLVGKEPEKDEGKQGVPLVGQDAVVQRGVGRIVPQVPVQHEAVPEIQYERLPLGIRVQHLNIRRGVGIAAVQRKRIHTPLLGSEHSPFLVEDNPEALDIDVLLFPVHPDGIDQLRIGLSLLGLEPDESCHVLLPVGVASGGTNTFVPPLYHDKG